MLIVLVVVVLLALGAYTFTDIMMFERQAAAMYEREIQARAIADSAIEWTAAILGEPVDGTNMVNLYNNPQLFQGVLLVDGGSPASRGRFTVLASAHSDGTGTDVRFGLTDESSKLNLNVILEYGLGDADERDLLMRAFPDMTADVADAILDYIDSDSIPRENGAEDEYYGTLTPAYQAKNGPLESLDELLRVRGVTAYLLYGEDANRNGLLDPSENDGTASPPADNADGVLQRGWSPFLTAYSRERNRRLDGTKRIDVNQDDLAALYDDLLEEFDADTARFIVAYRLFGTQQNQDSGRDGEGASGGGGQGGEEGERAGGGNQGGGQGGAQGGGQGGGNQGGGQQGASGGQAGGGQGTGAGSGTGQQSSPNATSVQRGGMELSGGGQQQISSLYDLIGSTVQAQLVGGQSETLESPWSDDPSTLGADLPKLLDVLTTTQDEFIEGRINISQAPRAVLLSIPEIEETVIDQILAAQASGRANGADTLSATAGWLYTDGLVDLETMRQLDRFVTGRGHVYRMQVVGHYDGGGPSVRLEATIDATQLPPRIISVRDLSSLGRGFVLAVPP